MRHLFIMLLLIVSITSYGQSATANLQELKKALSSKEYTASEIKVSTAYNPTIYMGWFAGKHREVKLSERCIFINYVLTSNKTKFKRELYIPLSVYHSKAGRIYYSDQWISGPHFDHQGGSFEVDSKEKQVIKNIKYSNK
ncbi:MAG: hypothetical protein PUF62_02105 [Bacteroidales bacterium]|nr:hypothetical protein [Bacteroidales bacterium]